jgi:drug/metabolite transporter (DMT)-like permease
MSARHGQGQGQDMQRKDRIDTFGALSLSGFALFLAFNQVIIKLVNEGLQPVFFAGLRSFLAIFFLGGWILWRQGRLPRLERRHAGWGLLVGVVFGFEFVFLFMALDLTTVTRTAILLYSMPIWMALGAHFVLPGEGMTPLKATGLAIAFAGVVTALATRGEHPQATASLIGDVLALLAAMCWAAIALVARGTSFCEVRPDAQLFWQVVFSAPLLLALSPLFGPLIRDFQLWHVGGVIFQAAVVVSAGFVFWLWLLSVYPPSGVASFSFLTPVFGVLLGWLLLGEEVGPSLLVSLVLVTVGIVMINRPVRRPDPV